MRILHLLVYCNVESHLFPIYLLVTIHVIKSWRCRKRSVEYLSVSPYYGNRQYIRVIEHRTQKHIVLWAHISLSLLGPRSSIDYKRLWKRILQKYMRWGWKIYITINKALYKRNNSIYRYTIEQETKALYLVLVLLPMER